jgi:hypothetical protein
MKHRTGFAAIAVLLILGTVLGACGGTFEQNDDGSWAIGIGIAETDIQQAIDKAIDDPMVRGVTVDLHEGYLSVRGEKDHPDGSGTDSLSFRLDLGVSDGQLTAMASEARFNGEPIDDDVVERWNERMARNLERGAKRHPRSTLESVSIDEDTLTMTWQVEPRE